MMNILDYIYFHLYFFYKRSTPKDDNSHLSTVIPLRFTLGVIANTIINLLALFIFHLDINEYFNIGILVISMVWIHYIYINKKRGSFVVYKGKNLYKKQTSILIFSLLVFVLVFCLMILPAIFKETGIYDRFLISP